MRVDERELRRKQRILDHADETGNAKVQRPFQPDGHLRGQCNAPIVVVRC